MQEVRGSDLLAEVEFSQYDVDIWEDLYRQYQAVQKQIDSLMEKSGGQ